jgi:hypothetical protein
VNVAYIDGHKTRFGVEPICLVLSAHGMQIAPSTYYAAMKNPVSASDLADAYLVNELVCLRHTSHVEEVTGARVVPRVHVGEAAGHAGGWSRLAVRDPTVSSLEAPTSEEIEVSGSLLERGLAQNTGEDRRGEVLDTQAHPEIGQCDRPRLKSVSGEHCDT